MRPDRMQPSVRKLSRVQLQQRADIEKPQHFAGRLSMENIYGSWWASARDGFFTVRWGRFFAYLHQFDPASRATLIEACEAGQHQRDHAHGTPAFGD